MRGLMSFVNSKYNVQVFICICKSLRKFDYTCKRKDTSKTENALNCNHSIPVFFIILISLHITSLMLVMKLLFLNVLIGGSCVGKYNNSMEFSRLHNGSSNSCF